MIQNEKRSLERQISQLNEMQKNLQEENYNLQILLKNNKIERDQALKEVLLSLIFYL